ncbi:hypothetical protein Talka_00414 [Tepidimonas alkaliphilus]|uniref:Uncharacterized protein n=1 Tax=Tepidimonas alkaliphilus TaxID=2588942 RepID=A0A554WB09_9BURK|nr:hypothetical protein [Tepidimonas alkaliphilus]TSE20751.1 hypothetical protein Talka_00414 [Tepidimonas alkaliphilus]
MQRRSAAIVVEEVEELLNAARAVATLVECLMLDAIDGECRPDPRLVLNATAAVGFLADEARRRTEEALDQLTRHA